MTTTPEEIITDTWRDFTEDLAGRIGDVTPGSFEFVEVCRAGDRLQLITFRATNTGRVRCTISDDALPAGPGHIDALPALASAGFHHLPTRREHVLDVTRRQYSVTAVHCIRFLREIWDIPFPTFLILRDPAHGWMTLFASEAPLFAATREHLRAVPDLAD